MGNPTSYLGQTLTWEGKQLTAAGTNAYAYDENGLRVQKTTGSGTTDYFYNGSVLMGLTKGNDTLLFSYDQRGKVQAVRFNGTYYYYLRNGQGDIIKLIDNSGNTVVEYAYDTWGKQLSCTGTLASTLGVLNPFRYRGYVYDEETQWYYLQSRYYDPETGRFLSADVMLSTGQGVLGHNTYVYCGNSPASRMDFAGNSWVSILIEVITDGLDYVIDKVEEITSTFNVCISQGYAGNASLRIFDDIQAACLSIDTKGNIAIQYQPLTGGITTNSTPSASFVLTTTIVFAPSIRELEGMGYALGGSCFSTFYGLGGGFDLNLLEKSSSEGAYLGFTSSAGIGTPSSEAHGNYGLTFTWDITRVNVYRVSHYLVNQLREWGEKYE
ncbi:MAG: RHS repeat-associated core domain-containing protein, partial [Clostridia bacterium]|nr:RHS repeat-associated core domain-containing protein [Clostridia bacterium]